MAGLPNTIMARMLKHAGAFVGIVMLQASVDIFTLHDINSHTSTLENTWLEGATVLGQIDFTAQAFRTAEVQRALAPQPLERMLAEKLMRQHETEVAQLERRYLLLRGPSGAQDFKAFNIAWAAYLQAVAADTNAGAKGDPALSDTTLESAYDATNNAIDALIDKHRSEGASFAARVSQLSNQTITFDIGTALLALLVAITMTVAVRRNVLRPIQRITHVMTRLAAGERKVPVPTGHGLQEITEMAAACEVFRRNVKALDAAHAAARAAEEEARKLARHDALTGLPNRRVFSAELETALHTAQDGKSSCSVLLIDLDEFKKVNDLQGHQMGDAVLCTVADRLQGTMRKSDLVARLGGDEFAVILRGGEDLHQHQERTSRFAARLLSIIRQPIETVDSRVEIGASIGISCCGAGTAAKLDASSLLRAADIAMYRAKQSGRSTFRFFEQSMDDEMRAREALERDLVRALNSGEIHPYYQPLVDLGRGGIGGFEALARWRHPERGFVPPDIFIPIVEQLGLMSTLTTSILRQACQDARHWPQNVHVAINVSPIELRDVTLLERFATILAETGFNPHRLEVEITETALVNDIEGAKTILSALQAMGIIVSLDDFGTGYSSLYHLRELKFDKIKIDRSFVQAMQTSRESEKIVDAILGLTNSLHLPTVAEGVENRDVQRMLTRKGCSYGQGYLFGKAVPAEDVLPLLTQAQPNEVPA